MIISDGLLLVVLAVLYVDVKSQENVPGGMCDLFYQLNVFVLFFFFFFFLCWSNLGNLI